MRLRLSAMEVKVVISSARNFHANVMRPVFALLRLPNSIKALYLNLIYTPYGKRS